MSKSKKLVWASAVDLLWTWVAVGTSLSRLGLLHVQFTRLIVDLRTDATAANHMWRSKEESSNQDISQPYFSSFSSLFFFFSYATCVHNHSTKILERIIWPRAYSITNRRALKNKTLALVSSSFKKREKKTRQIITWCGMVLMTYGERRNSLRLMSRRRRLLLGFCVCLVSLNTDHLFQHPRHNLMVTPLALLFR